MLNNMTEGQNLYNSIFGPMAGTDESLNSKPEAVIDYNTATDTLCNYNT
jgi:hypothetical protein